MRGNFSDIVRVNFSRLTLQQTVDQVEQWAFSGNQPSSPKATTSHGRTDNGGRPPAHRGLRPHGKTEVGLSCEASAKREGQQSEDRRQGTVDQTGRGKCLAIVNPHSVETARRDPEFAAAIRAADLVTPDGVGILLASKILNAGIPEVVNGPDLFEALCCQLNEKQTGTRMFFLGSTPENLKAIEEKFKTDFPNLGIVGTYSPPYKPQFSEEDLADMIDLVNRSGADILWVGLGAPKQEKWSQACRDRLNVKVIAPVGGVFDFYTGRVKLPPKWVQKMGLIFLYRFVQQPRRLLRRNLDSPVFICRVIRQRMRKGRSSDH